MTPRSRIRGAATVVLGVALAASTPLLAQQASAPPQAQAPAPPGAAKVMQLSMDQAVQMAMEANLGLKAEKLNLDMAAQGIVGARASFLPQFRSSASRAIQDRASSSFTDVSSGTISSSSVSVGASVNQQLPWYGGNYSVSWSNSRSATSSVGATFNPTLSSTFTVDFSQPLWQGFKTDGARVGLETSERQREIADLDLQSQVVSLQAQVRNAYLNLVAAVENRKVVGENMGAAQKQLDQTNAKLAVGTLAEIDVIQAKANLAGNQVSVIGADEQIATAQDALRALIMDPSRADYWDVQFEATDSIEANPTPPALDVNALIANALTNRIDLIEARKNLAISDINLKLDRDLTKPSVNAVAAYSASGTGGTENTYSQTFPPTLLSSANKGFGSVLGEAFGGAYPAWSVGVNVAYPIGQTAARSNLARAQIQRHQTEINIRSLELQVASSVRQAVRDVQTAVQRVQATKSALDANTQQYDAEQRKLDVGLSTTFDLLQKQVLLAQARLTDLSARIAYQQALQALERVQRIQ